MHAVLRRIAIQGGLTALVLGVVGLVFAELAANWMSAAPGPNPDGGVEVNDPNGELAATLRTRVPLVMAGAGFAFVALTELFLHLRRSRNATPTPAAAQPQPDDGEKLLLQLLAQSEAASRPESGGGSRESGNRESNPPPATPPAAS